MAPPEAKTRRGRWMLAAVGAVFVLPVAIGWVAYLSGRTPGTLSNYGALLEPRALTSEPFVTLRGKWVLLQFDGGECASRCEKKHYTMRQARRAQGTNANRVERLWVVTDAVQPRAELLQAIAGTRLSFAGAAAGTAFPRDAPLEEHLWVIDPLGNLMMRFPRDADPGRVVKDLERLLKYSGFG